MKASATTSMQLGQQLHMTPQLLQSIRLLQLDGLQLELEIRRVLEHNPLLELDEEPVASAMPEPADAQAEVASFDELPETSMWDVRGAGWNDADDDGMQRIAAGESTDPQLRILQRLAAELDTRDLEVAAYWLENCDDAGYLTAPLDALTRRACALFDRHASEIEGVRQRLLAGDPAGVAACDLRECLLAQLAALPGTVAARPLAARLIRDALDALAAHDIGAVARRLGCDEADAHEAVRLVLSLDPKPGEAGAPEADQAVVPDVVVWKADAGWRVALNPRSTPRISINAGYERAVAEGEGGAATAPMRELLQEARWFTRGLSMRYDTLLRTARVIVERQAAFLEQGEEAMAPLTLKEVADAIGMHESTVSRITTGKYLQTPRGTIEMKRFFAVRLDGANVSGAAVRAMVKRLIDAEPAQRPLADDAIAALLARQGVHIARRTVAKYREQLDIAPARARRNARSHTLLARTG
ncbi:RNA polymerase factor sigma-54 [Luteimonas yindakuii]|uniref:RNA polymerase factor sigma-54 n=1 Tax=Luteimonas yindakuii TaxID=2565782 RepID=UPI0010A525A8|nr:RNA polymerase factor sigma-54 [Luteimonas yindakuii]QCO67692.1 RNA polymerase factor sigma-54 [Luteimonas yindakuii]